MDVPITEERPLELTTTKVKKEPFVKNLFVGKFDKSMLVYPEVLNNERLKELESMADAVRKYFDENVDTPKIDREKQIPPEVLEGFKSLGLFGLQVPSDYGGLDLTATEYARMCEVTGRDGSIGVTLAAHNSIGLKGILLCGNEEQKAKYLPKLATGEHIAAFCLTEPSSGSDAASIQMTATLSSDKKFYHLNGSKIYISNGGIADVMTVFAKVKVDMPDRTKEGVVTAFIVERGFGGVTSGPPEDKLGIRGSNTTSVFFDDTPVPVENVLLKVGDGFKVYYAVNRVQFEKPLSEFHMIKDKVSKMTAQLYAIESMVYVSSAILDVVEEPDCALEKLRNPMAHPFLVLQKVWENRRDVADKPIMDLDLYTSLHPSLKLDIAAAFCHDAKKRIKLKEDEINDEVVGMVNMRKRDVANRVFQEKMYAAVHPLTKNY
ncbi:acyl-CoA dehydrogenase, putative [Ixodes scapularis]|uniref:Acyl-CoA dehydrogenase, putative n=1 Tax=Ixodes scapularis TaxID=6945 RepID=B7Q326_IXOSC|nr:acyl-CoA dehydrogenase, putative [Ixodes scapularis]|eukprot:XP_002411124.1 acyl-CoA dehydrogenase, putative [Ixodes scapularis]